MPAPRPPAKITKFPRAFARFARAHNNLVDVVTVLTNMKAGNGVSITWSERDVMVTNTKPDTPIVAGAGISVSTNTARVIITNLNP